VILVEIVPLLWVVLLELLPLVEGELFTGTVEMDGVPKKIYHNEQKYQKKKFSYLLSGWVLLLCALPGEPQGCSLNPPILLSS